MKNDEHVIWEGHMKALATSGQSRAEYCREHGLHYGRMYRWQCRLANAAGSKRPRAFVKAKAEGSSKSPAASTPSGVRLMVGGNAVIEFPTSTDPRWIAELARAIGGQPR